MRRYLHRQRRKLSLRLKFAASLVIQIENIDWLWEHIFAWVIHRMVPTTGMSDYIEEIWLSHTCLYRY